MLLMEKGFLPLYSSLYTLQKHTRKLGENSGAYMEDAMWKKELIPTAAPLNIYSHNSGKCH